MRSAAADGNNVSGQKKNVRDAAVTKLRNRMSGLMNELGQLLDDNDPLWLAFGLNQPGARQLTVTPWAPQSSARLMVSCLTPPRLAP